MATSQTRYVVINTVDITNAMIAESVGDHSSIVYCLAKAQAILEFNVAFPNTMGGRTKYTYAQIVQYLIDNKVAWTLASII